MNKIVSANFSTVYGNQIYELDSMNGEKVSYSRALASGSGYSTMTFSFNNDGTLVPGSFANIYLLAENRPNTIALPNEALVEEQGLYFVFIKMCEESYSKRQVKIGASNGKEVEITDGIHSGDNVVVKGAYHVKLASTSASLPAHSHSH
jgi:multidrug efflux pump subunit AcrA (membrane-fusion protein)